MEWGAREVPGHRGGLEARGPVRGVGSPAPLRRDDPEPGVVPAADGGPAGLRGVVRCSCGWTKRIRVIPGPGSLSSTDRAAALLGAAEAEWRHHVEAQDAMRGIEEAVRSMRRAEAELDRAVRGARGIGAPVSWQSIGDAVGMTRQSAHSRWREV